MDESFLFKKCKNDTKKLIISFGGMGSLVGMIQPFEFLNFFTNNNVEYDLMFVTDQNKKWYQKGIKNISTDIPSTLEFLKNKIKDYEKVIFVGASAGGYASILFGSLLNIDKVIVFFPQTILDNLSKSNDKTYFNLRKYINKKTKYFVYCDLSKTDDVHHPRHCENISHFKNVKVIKKDSIKLKEWRNNGLLEKYLINEL